MIMAHFPRLPGSAKTEPSKGYTVEHENIRCENKHRQVTTIAYEGGSEMVDTSQHVQKGKGSFRPRKEAFPAHAV